jgi:orotate phosphoribosyltransferase-like protein
VKRDEQLQKPVERPLVEIKWTPVVDPRRLRRIGEILADILDTATRSGGG